MNKQKFENELFQLEVKTENGESMFDVELVAKSLGIVDIKNEVGYVRWHRVNNYLGKNSPLVAKGDFISEPMVYKLAFKANNALAEKFQDWLAVEVLPQIRKQGSYLANNDPRSQLKLIYQFGEETAQRVDDLVEDVNELKNNQLLTEPDYRTIANMVQNKVRIVCSQQHLNNKARSELFKDLNSGIKRITGAVARNRIKAKQFDEVVEFINNWMPSTATMTIIKQMELLEDA